MTPETPIPPSSEREAQITALLLGELPSEEAFVLGRAIEQDPELRNLYQRLKATIPLVKEATAVPVEQVAPVFSENRRQALLQHFKTVKPKEFSTAPGKRVRWLEMAAVLAIVALLAAALLPSLARSKSRSLSASRDISFYRQRESEDKLRQGDGFADNESLARKLPEMPPPVGTKQSGEFAGTPGTKPSSIILPPLGESTSEKKPASLFDDDATGTLAQNASTRRSGSDGWGQVTNGFGEPQTADALDGFSKSPLSTSNAFVSRYPYTASDTNQLTLAFGNGQDLGGDRNGTQSYGWSDTARQKQGKVEVAGGRLSPLSREKLQESLKNGVELKSELEGVKPGEELAKNTKDGVDFFYELGKTDLPLNGDPVTGLPMERRLYRAGLDDTASTTSDSVKLKSDSDTRPAAPSQQVEAGQKSTPTITAEKEGKSLVDGDWMFSTSNPNVGFVGGLSTPSPAASNTVGSPENYSLGVAGYAHAPSANTLASDETSLYLNSGAGGGFGGRAFKGIILPQTNNDKSVALNFRSPSLGTTVQESTPQDLALNDNNRGFRMPKEPVTELAIEDGRKNGDSRTIANRPPTVGGIETLDAKLKEQTGKIKEAQLMVDSLRERLRISDSLAASDAPTMLMTPETYRKMETEAIELKSGYSREKAQLEELKALSPEKLTQVIPTVAPDPLLNSLLEQRTKTQQTLGVQENESNMDAAELNKLRIQIEDLDGKIGNRVGGIVVALSKRVESEKQGLDTLEKEVKEAKQEDSNRVSASRPYFEAKRKLEEQISLSRVIEMKIAQERIESSLPKTAMVEVMDRAVAVDSQPPSTWERIRRALGGKIERSARFKVERDQSDVAFSGDPRTMAMGYDPYFIQTEFETIQSDKVLGKVVQDLQLDKKWASKGRGQNLTASEAMVLLRKNLDVRPVRNTSFVEVGVKSDNPKEAAELANAVADAYRDFRLEQRRSLSIGGIDALEIKLREQRLKIFEGQSNLNAISKALKLSPTNTPSDTIKEPDVAAPRPPATNAPIPQPEVDSRENPFSTFSLNVSDVSFKLSATSLEKGIFPEAASIRSEEFINAFDYRDPEPSPGAPVGFSWERARYPFAQNRDVVRFSLKTAAEGRQAGRPMNLVLLLDNSGSMERADRVEIIHQALRVLATQLHSNDKLSVVTFARTPRLWVDGVPGSQAAQVADGVSNLTPQGGTNLEEAMKLAYQTAIRHFLTDGINRVVLLTDGAANLGEVEPANLRQMVESNRKQGIALDCFGIGWEGYNDELLESLSRNGDGRYGFLNTPEEVSTGFANQLAGALHVAAADVKVQVEFNTNRVKAYRQIGYAKHQLTKEQFRDNTVDAAELAAAESGNALYIVEVNPEGQGPLGTVRVRYKLPGTSDYREQEWSVPYTGSAVALQQSAPSLRLASTASAFSEWLAASPFASDVAPEKLIELLRGVPEVYGADPRPKKLEWMLRQANSLIGNAEVKAKTPVKSATADRDPGRVQFP